MGFLIISKLLFYFVSSPFLYIFCFLVMLTIIRLAYVVRHIIPSILSKLLLSLCILFLFLYALYHSFYNDRSKPVRFGAKLDVGAMNVLV